MGRFYFHTMFPVDCFLLYTWLIYSCLLVKSSHSDPHSARITCVTWSFQEHKSRLYLCSPGSVVQIFFFVLYYFNVLLKTTPTPATLCSPSYHLATDIEVSAAMPPDYRAVSFFFALLFILSSPSYKTVCFCLFSVTQTLTYNQP